LPHHLNHDRPRSLPYPPQVKIDPSAPVPLWGLSQVGRRRAAALTNAGWFLAA
jgi:hypothetical protein